VRVEVLYEGETFWLDQRRTAELLGVDLRTVNEHLRNINEHLRNIYDSGELSEEATLRKIRMVRTESTREVARDITFYNLDAIISVGYRVNSSQATQFRIWATHTLREFIVKGFVLDDELYWFGVNVTARVERYATVLAVGRLGLSHWC